MKAFISYSHRDKELLSELHSHLSALRRQNLLITWTDRQIPAGGVIDDHVDEQLEEAELYLLLISSDFISSNYCFEREFDRALKRHEADKAVIVPIIARDCDWSIPKLKQFKALPEDGRAITGRHWTSRDEAFAEVARELRVLIESRQAPKKPKSKGKKFVPDERHITDEQREELRKIGEEVVERQTTNTLKMTAEKAGAIIGRQFGFLWSNFAEAFGLKENGLKSLPREDYAKAKSWLQQYRAQNESKLKSSLPQKYRHSVLKGIFGIGKDELGMTEDQIREFAAEKLEMQVASITELRNDQLKLVRDRIRYELTKKTRAASKKASKKPLL